MPSHYEHSLWYLVIKIDAPHILNKLAGKTQGFRSGWDKLKWSLNSGFKNTLIGNLLIEASVLSWIYQCLQSCLQSLTLTDIDYSISKESRRQYSSSCRFPQNPTKMVGDCIAAPSPPSLVEKFPLFLAYVDWFNSCNSLSLYIAPILHYTERFRFQCIFSTC
jgi:hypothetical protein